MNYRECLEKGELKLKDNGISDYKNDAFFLLSYVTGISRNDFFLEESQEITEEKSIKYMELIDKRTLHVPLQHITGEQNFFGYDFFVNEHVLIPRFDTECLIESVLSNIRNNLLSYNNKIKTLDLCTGSGCIAITLYKEIVKQFSIEPDVFATDISKEAIEVAKKNAIKLEAKVNFACGDLFDAISEETFDVIVSNPPYIPTGDIIELEDEVKDFDPYLALDGDVDGLKFYRNIIENASNYLKSNGLLCFEIGYNQKDEVIKLMKAKGYGEIQFYKDLAGLDRVVIGRFKQ